MPFSFKGQFQSDVLAQLDVSPSQSGAAACDGVATTLLAAVSYMQTAMIPLSSSGSDSNVADFEVAVFTCRIHYDGAGLQMLGDIEILCTCLIAPMYRESCMSRKQCPFCANLKPCRYISKTRCGTSVC